MPCPCGKSSDAYSIYLSGVGQCFSCDQTFAPDGAESRRTAVPKEATPLIEHLEFRPLTARGISQETCKKYGYGIGEKGGKAVQVAPYRDRSGRVTGQKVRFPGKDFMVTGSITGNLFGMNLLRKDAKMVVITEGEVDALSVAEAMGSWPALSVPNGSAGAAAAISENLDILETCEKIVLWFDNDEPGQKAVEQCVELFSPGKVALVDAGAYKDANDMLKAAGGKAVRDAVWGAREWRPDGVVNLADLRERVKAPVKMGTAYPWARLNEKLYGFRPGELITWTAGTGTGKSAVVSELVYHLVCSADRVGLVYLEEGVDRAGKRLIGLALNKPIHLPGNEYTDEEFQAAWDATIGRGNVFAYDHFGSLDSDVLLNRIRYMRKALHVKTVVLDHISMVVSGSDMEVDERRLLDKTVTDLRSLCEETGLTVHMVSHLKRVSGTPAEEGGQISLAHLRGSQALSQLSDAVIALERNQQSEDNVERNTTNFRVLKNRYAGITGPAGSVVFNPDTGRLTEVDDVPWEENQDGAASDF